MQTRIGGHEFEVMFELHHICPSLLVGVWSQLEVFLLDSLDSSKKKIALTLLAHMFSEEDSDFAFKYRRLWNSFKLWYVSDFVLITIDMKWAQDLVVLGFFCY